MAFWMMFVRVVVVPFPLQFLRFSDGCDDTWTMGAEKVPCGAVWVAEELF